MNDLLWGIGLVGIVISLYTLIIAGYSEDSKILVSDLCLVLISIMLLLNPFWGAWWLFLQNVVWAVPTLVWVVAGITAYFTFNHVYASWRMYVYAHPESFAKKILNPWPTILMPPTRTPERVGHYMFGTILFILTWLIAFLCYTAWLIFGGGIAKLLHLMPRE